MVFKRDHAPTEWYIGLENWVLQDGNYTDFAVGQRRQFALEFSYDRSARLQLSEATERTARYSGRGNVYVVRGELIRDGSGPAPHGFVLDFGLKAYDNWMVLDDLEPPSAGSWLEGEITLFVDPFEYMDRLANQKGMPPLIQTWEILGIEKDISPTIQVEYGDPRYFGPDEGPMRIADPERELYESVERTRMREDGPGWYQLRCALLPDEPTSSMARSGKRSPYGPL
jgi:hypothetical protein